MLEGEIHEKVTVRRVVGNCTDSGNWVYTETFRYTSRSRKNSASPFPWFSLSLEVPVSWKKAELLEGASIQLANLRTNQYLIVTEELVADYIDGYNITDFTAYALENMRYGSNVVDFSSAVKIEVGGRSARQFRIDLADRYKVSYLMTCVATERTFYLIYLYSMTPGYAAAIPVFERILASVTL